RRKIAIGVSAGGFVALAALAASASMLRMGKIARPQQTMGTIAVAPQPSMGVVAPQPQPLMGQLTTGPEPAPEMGKPVISQPPPKADPPPIQKKKYSKIPRK